MTQEKETRGSIRKPEAVEALKTGHVGDYTTSREQRRLKFGFTSSRKKSDS